MSKHLQISTSEAGHQVEMFNLEPRHITPVGLPFEHFRDALKYGAMMAGRTGEVLLCGGYEIAGPGCREIAYALEYYVACNAWEGDYGLDAKWDRRYWGEESYTEQPVYVGGNR